jgi:hypothetical protein
MNKRLVTLLKVGVTVAGLIYVVSRVDAAEVAGLLSGVNWLWLVIAFALFNAGLVLRAYRWLLLLAGLQVRASLARLTELYFVGNFFNAFLPSGFGGDAVRILEAARDVPPSVAAGTVILDRLTGLLMLFAMALAVVPFRPANFPEGLARATVLVSVVGLLGGLALIQGRFLRRFGRWLPAKISPAGDGPVAKVLDAVQGSGTRAVAKALAVSAAFNLLVVGWYAACGRAIGLDVSLVYYILVIPILSVALLVPSVSGLGVNESLAPLLFAGAGLEPAQAVALSLLVFLIMRAASLVGAAIYIASLTRANRERSAVSDG